VVIAGFHLVIGNLQMLVGMMMDVMQSIHEVSYRLMLVRGVPEVIGQA
jgi:hypothetical protein